MNSRLTLALALAGAIAAPLSTAYAQSDEKETTKPELVAQSEEKETTKPELVAQSEEKETTKPELVAQEDESKKDSPYPKATA